MLVNLKVKNVALIKSLTIDFSNGLNILSGETGAGKSILIDSLNFVLGCRAEKTLIRSGENQMEVSAVFECREDLSDIFESIGMESDSAILLTRSLDVNGKGKCYVNGQTVPLSVLKSISSRLCDIHGQSEHHSLIRPESHIELLDKFIGEDLKKHEAELEVELKTFKDIRKQLVAFGKNDDDRERLIGVLKFQIDEIDAANMRQGELEKLIEKKNRLAHMEKIITALSEADKAIGGGELSAIDGVSTACASLQPVASVDEKLEKLSDRLLSVKYELEDIYGELENSLSEYGEDDISEAGMDRLEARIDRIKSIHKKYGITFEDVLDFKAKAEDELNRLINSEKVITELKVKLRSSAKVVYRICEEISNLRRGASEVLQQKITDELKELGFKNAQFKVVFEDMPQINEIAKRATTHGFDVLEFYMTANKGQPLRPLAKVISGGEASRFMLAIKTICSEIDNIPCMVFDEIDSGISGEIAQMVAKKFAVISRRHQILAITHLPQISAMGDKNFLIQKSDFGEETVTDIKELSSSEHELEVARLAGGNNIGEHAVLHARELIGWCDDFKKIYNKF